jgi:hypothetical protein
MALPLQSFTLTPEQLKSCAATLLSEHQIVVDATQPSGIIKSHGAVIDWSYNGSVLTVQCMSKPWVISESAVQSGIAGFFKIR